MIYMTFWLQRRVNTKRSMATTPATITQPVPGKPSRYNTKMKETNTMAEPVSF